MFHASVPLQSRPVWGGEHSAPVLRLYLADKWRQEVEGRIEKAREPISPVIGHVNENVLQKDRVRLIERAVPEDLEIEVEMVLDGA